MTLLNENVPAYLIGIKYSEQKKTNRLIFYEPNSEKLLEWFGKDHEPYCLCNIPIEQLKQIPQVIKHPSFKRFETIKKYDSLNDCEIDVTKIITKDPRAIGGGKQQENLRDIIPNIIENAKVWEAKISYESSFIYDKEIEMGMPYIIIDNKLLPYNINDTESKINEIADKIKSIEKRWIRLCEYPVPNLTRVGLDIEVLGETYKIPNPRKAKYPIISVALVGSDGKRQVFVLLRDGVIVGEDIVDAPIKFFDNENELILATFDSMLKYSIIITFNGDNFDMTYLYNRAINLGIPKENIPLIPHRQMIEVVGRIHLDLYRLFFNTSLKNYAFQAKYKNVSLDAISLALLNEGKIKIDKDMSSLTYTQLAKYNLQDSVLTLKLTTYDDGLVMKLIFALMRISNMPMEDINRYPISSWIRSLIFFEHRKRGHLIPNREDIIDFPYKGQVSTKAMITGKKYKGGTVVEPIAGVHFNATVMDFASLYPSILKTRNLGYSTVNCNHLECKSNKIPETDNWVCKKNIAIEGEVIGLLKDLRVNWYKKNKKESAWYKVIEQAMKVICNASYGVFGDNSFSLYCPPVAESTTAIGRNSIYQTIEKAKSLGIIVLYGDTDSVFLKNPTKEQIKILEEWSLKHLELDLEAEKTYRYVCLSSRKKNYLGVTQDGEVDVKGMTGKKKNVPLLIRNAFIITNKYLGQAQTLEEVIACKKSLKKVIKDIYYRIKCREFDLEELAFTITLGKNINAYEKTIPQHIRAAQILKKEVGIKLGKGDSISYIKCIPFKWMPEDAKKPIEVNVRPIQLAESNQINIEKYHEMLKTTFEQILDSLEIDYNSIIGIISIERFF